MDIVEGKGWDSAEDYLYGTGRRENRKRECLSRRLVVDLPADYLGRRDGDDDKVRFGDDLVGVGPALFLTQVVDRHRFDVFRDVRVRKFSHSIDDGRFVGAGVCGDARRNSWVMADISHLDGGVLGQDDEALAVVMVPYRRHVG